MSSRWSEGLSVLVGGRGVTHTFMDSITYSSMRNNGEKSRKAGKRRKSRELLLSFSLFIAAHFLLTLLDCFSSTSALRDPNSAKSRVGFRNNLEDDEPRGSCFASLSSTTINATNQFVL